MIFKQLHIENFQSHKDTLLGFDSNLNIIVGPSDTGKSSILRALKKIIRDVPAGKDFINEDATSMKLTLTIVKEDKEYTIVREVTPSKNFYYLDDQEYGGFGREIPQEIQNLLEMYLVELETSEEIDLHFTDQHDVPFMLGKGSAGLRSRLLGRVSGLHILDKCIKQANRDMRQINNDLKSKAEEKDALQTELDSFPDLDSLQALFDSLDKRSTSVKQCQLKRDKLQEFCDRLVDVVSQGKKLKHGLDLLPNLSGVDFNALQLQCARLGSLEDFRQNMSRIDKQVSETSARKLPEISTNFSNLEQKLSRLEILLSFANQLTGIFSRIDKSNVDISRCPKIDEDFFTLTKHTGRLKALETLDSRLATIESEISKLDAVKFKQLDKDLTQAKQAWLGQMRTLGVCPTCKQSTLQLGEYRGCK